MTQIKHTTKHTKGKLMPKPVLDLSKAGQKKTTEGQTEVEFAVAVVEILQSIALNADRIANALEEQIALDRALLEADTEEAEETEDTAAV